MYGDPVKRISVPLAWIDEGDVIVAYDGNNNPAGKIKKDTLETVYSTPSIRLAAGPKTTFMNLGTYYSLEDAKHMVELQERAEAIPVFVPGRLIGWIDKERRIKLKDTHSFWSRLLTSFIRFFI